MIRTTIARGAVLATVFLGALVLPSIASATDQEPVADVIWKDRACQAGDHSIHYRVPEGSTRLRLTVHHDWATAGVIEVVDHKHGRKDWRFEQPWHWIVGSYHVESPQLNAGSYSIGIFNGRNLLAHHGHCTTTLERLKPGY
jgi:hypothetical protein